MVAQGGEDRLSEFRLQEQGVELSQVASQKRRPRGAEWTAVKVQEVSDTLDEVGWRRARNVGEQGLLHIACDYKEDLVLAGFLKVAEAYELHVGLKVGRRLVGDRASFPEDSVSEGGRVFRAAADSRDRPYAELFFCGLGRRLW